MFLAMCGYMTTSDTTKRLQRELSILLRLLLRHVQDDPAERIALISMLLGETGLACYEAGVPREYAKAGIDGAYDAIEDSKVHPNG